MSPENQEVGLWKNPLVGFGVSFCRIHKRFKEIKQSKFSVSALSKRCKAQNQTAEKKIPTAISIIFHVITFC